MMKIRKDEMKSKLCLFRTKMVDELRRSVNSGLNENKSYSLKVYGTKYTM